MKCSYCLSKANYKCACRLSYMCTACLGAHLVTLEGHPFENINIEFNNSRLNHLRSKIEKDLNYIEKTKSEILLRTKFLINSLEFQCKQAIENLELQSRDLIELYNHDKFCKSEMPTVEKIESDKRNDHYNIEEIIKSMLSILTKNQYKSSVKFESNAKFNKKSCSNVFPKKVNNSFQNKKVMCPREHYLEFFSNIIDRNLTANISITMTVSCDMCGTKYIKSAWCCIGCIYDLCEPCFNLASQNTHTSNVSKNFQIVCSNNHKLLDVKPSIKTNINCSYCNTNNLESARYCNICNFSLCKLCSNDQIYAKPAVKLANQCCPNSHPLYYYQNTGEFIKRKKNSFNNVTCNTCFDNWNGGSWACRICDFYFCIRCIDKKKSVEMNKKSF